MHLFSFKDEGARGFIVEAIKEYQSTFCEMVLKIRVDMVYFGQKGKYSLTVLPVKNYQQS